MIGFKINYLFCYPTWIRTKTGRIRICSTTIILSGNLGNLKKLNLIQPFCWVTRIRT